jgi:hypothetical protein
MNALSLEKTVTKKSCRIIGRCRNTGELYVRSLSPTDPSGRSSLVSLQPNLREIYAPSVLRFKVNSRTLRPGAFLIIVRLRVCPRRRYRTIQGEPFLSVSSLSKKDKGWFEHRKHPELSMGSWHTYRRRTFSHSHLPPARVGMTGASGCRRKTRSGAGLVTLQSATHQFVAAGNSRA